MKKDNNIKVEKKGFFSSIFGISKEENKEEINKQASIVIPKEIVGIKIKDTEMIRDSILKENEVEESQIEYEEEYYEEPEENRQEESQIEYEEEYYNNLEKNNNIGMNSKIKREREEYMKQRDIQNRKKVIESRRNKI